MSAYFDALAEVFAGVWAALPAVGGFIAVMVAIFATAALTVAARSWLRGDRVPPSVWVLGVLLSPVNALVVVAPLVQMGVIR